MGGPQSPAHPSYQHRGAQGCGTTYTRGAPSIPLTGAPGTGRRRPRSEARVLRPQSRGGPGSARSQGPWSPPVTPAQTPVGGPTPVIRALVEMSELRQPEADLQAPVQAQGPVEAQVFGAAGEEAASPSSSSSPVAPSFSAYAESLPQEALTVLMADLVAFLLLKYRTKEPICKAEMLNMVLGDHRDHFPVVFSQACECMQLVFGVDVKEVDPRECTYVLVPTLGLTCDAVLSDGQRPKAGLLVLILGQIALYGDRTPEEDVWELLSIMEVYVGEQHCIYGEPRELLTEVWVQEGYLEYRQVPHSDPTRYEFLWGPRAYVETSKWQVLEHLLRVNGWDLRSFLSLCAEGVSDEEEGA
ncbi:melanoma-associated antigen 8-like isoform X1 [Balaenoptera acutorostrata]|uniref:Melanoma-associated antigen 8-like isoform X1 n=1 Tax=Balaenoptera acutorostrata TaxID=9767 RepID=A0ABM3SX94_BALAC|nr:melanoma-associated antigen 8-like isoform X1 [Balaenoptera acutorostrata]XP_057394475.1 melanoma-associated antigen 8-like isoform X1 [Balaenoptera acutorostrata]